MVLKLFFKKLFIILKYEPTTITGYLDEARRLYEESLEMREIVHGKHSLKVAESMQNLGIDFTIRFLFFFLETFYCMKKIFSTIIFFYFF